MFNALIYIKELEAVGFRREQAETQVQFVMNLMNENFATKSDMAELKTEMKTEMAELRSDFAKLRSEVAIMETRIILKLGTMLVGSWTLSTAILGLLIELK